jgi:hypothetical protein
MALRTFLDSAGNEWLAFDVVPREDERRHLSRRSPDESPTAADDRRDDDRRFTVGGRSPLVTAVAEGWLCFEHGTDRRRLFPIPADWQRCTDAELEAFCHAARPVRREATNLEETLQAEP